MKTLIPILAALVAVLVLAALPATAEPPFNTVLVLNTTSTVANFELAEAVKVDTLRLWGVLPLSETPQTVTVSRVGSRISYVGTNGVAVTNGFTNAITSFVLASNVASASTTLTTGVWTLLGDTVRVAGPTNCYLETQGTR